MCKSGDEKNEWFANSALQMQDGVQLVILGAVWLGGCKMLN
jgi:hypothetical protein